MFDAIFRSDVTSDLGTPAARVVVLLLVLSSQAASVTTLNNDVQGTERMGEYIDDYVSESELILHTQSQARLITVYSDRYLTNGELSKKKQAKLKSEIEAKGLGVTLRDRNVTYYLSIGTGEFKKLNCLMATNLQNRREYILNEIGSGHSLTCNAENVTDRDEHFQLEAKFGN